MCYIHIMYPEDSWRITLPNILINPCEVAGLRSRRRCRGSTGESCDQHGPAESAAGVLEAKGAAKSWEKHWKHMIHMTQDCMTRHKNEWHYMTWHDITWHCMTWHNIAWHDTTLHGITWRATTLHMTLHSMIAHDILRYYMAYYLCQSILYASVHSRYLCV